MVVMARIKRAAKMNLIVRRENDDKKGFLKRDWVLMDTLSINRLFNKYKLYMVDSSEEYTL